VRAHGLGAWQQLVTQAAHGLRHRAECIIAEAGQREAGNDGWEDGVVNSAVAFAATLPVACDEEACRHFWQPIVEVTGSSIDLLRRRAEQARRAQGEAASAGRQDDAGGGAPGANPPQLVTTCLADICPEPVHWLVPDYFPQGKLALIAGDGGEGKSVLTLDLTACLTTGRRALGLQGGDVRPACEVLLLSCEDDFGDTVVPRLLSAGADLRRVHKIDGIRNEKGGVEPFNLAYYKCLERELELRPDVKLVIIDPAGAYVGQAGVDDYKESELRALLAPLYELAARRQVTILLVKHFHKGANPKAAYKVGGSVGYVNTVRASFVLVPDPDDKDRKLFLPLKNNLVKGLPGLAFRTKALTSEEQEAVLRPFGAMPGPDRERLAGQLFRVAWEGAVDMTAEAALAAGMHKERGPGRVEQAAEWLKQFLAGHAYPSDEVVKAGKAAGFTFDNIKEAKARLKAEDLRSTKNGFQGVWWCGFGDPTGWRLRPEPQREGGHPPGWVPWDDDQGEGEQVHEGEVP
jgi:hypothetical protein